MRKERISDRKRRLALAAVFCTFFLDNIAWSMVYPVFAPLFLGSTLFQEGTSTATKVAFLGLFLSVFHLMQFLFAPLIGEFSDRNGRRKAFLYTIFCTTAGFFLSAWGVEMRHLGLLFWGRVVTGAFSGNLSLCLAAISDLSPAKGRSRVHQFGNLSLIAGIAFILGAFWGGKLSDAHLSPYFSPSLPFWIGTLLTAGNGIFVWFSFEEPFVRNRAITFHLGEGWRNICLALQTKNLQKIYVIYLFFLLAWNIVLQFSPIFAVNTFAFSPSNLGSFMAFLGVCWALGSGIITKWLVSYLQEAQVLGSCLFGFSILAFLIIFAKSAFTFVLLVGIVVLLSGISWPLCTENISKKATQKMRGKVLGMSQSVQSFAMGCAPTAALFAYLSVDIPLLVAGGLGLVAFFLFLLQK